MQEKMTQFVKYYISHRRQEDEAIINGFNRCYADRFSAIEIYDAFEMLKALKSTPAPLLACLAD